jgi:hypothetical protein
MRRKSYIIKDEKGSKNKSAVNTTNWNSGLTKKKHFKEIIQEKINNSTNNFVFVLFSWRKAVPII